MLPVMPYSPMPGGMQRTPFWNENNQTYDSGVQQGFTNYVKPLFRYSIPLSLYNEVKQASIWTFFRDTVKGQTKPFLIKDPYDMWVQPVTVVRSGLTNGSSVFFCDTNSYMVRVDTLYISSLASVSSGYVRLGIEYGYDTDTGVLNVNTKAAGDVWTNGQTVAYYRKVKLAAPFTEASAIWNVFAAQLNLQELP